MAITVSLRKFIGLIAYPPGTIYPCASDIDPAEMWGGVLLSYIKKTFERRCMLCVA